MKKVWVLVLLLVSLQVYAGHKIEFRISPLGNLVYQMDCMAQVARFQCSRSDFFELWQTELTVNDLDTDMLDNWRSLRTKLDETVEFIETPEVDMATSPNFPINATNQLNVLEQTRIMAFAANSLENYQQQMEFLLSPTHVQAEITVLNHFWPRFEVWFNAEKLNLEQFVTAANQLAQKMQLNELLSAMRSFYRSELPADLMLPVYLIAHPKAKAHSSGLVFGQHSLIEVLKGEKAADRLAVVVHEIAHFYHERADLEHHMKSMNFFTDSNSQTGKVGYYLFNEALASAIGNGIFEKRLQDPAYFEKYLAYPMSFYANQGIDLAGKAAMPLVQKYLDHNQGIDQAFLQDLDNIWSKSLKDIKNAPKERLRHVGMLDLTAQTDSGNDDIINQLFGLIRPSSAQINGAAEVNSERFFLTRYPQLDALILADSWEQLKKLKLPKLDTSKAEGMYIISNENGAVRVIIVSPSKSYMVKQVESLLAQAHF